MRQHVHILYKRLDKLCDISIGKTPSRSEPRYWGKGHPWLSIADMKGNIVTTTKEEITDFAVQSLRCRKIPKGTILLSFKLSIGKIVFAGVDLYTNEAIAALPIKDTEELDKNYLFFALRVAKLIGANPAAKGNTLNSDSLAKIQIPLPPTIDDQRRIAYLLSKVENLIAQRKKSLEQLDTFVKSRFMEMFGDPVRNEKGWNKEQLEKLLEKIESGWSPKCEERSAEPSEWGILKLSAISSCNYNELENKAFSDNSLVKNWLEVKQGDLLFARKNTPDLVAACAYIFRTKPQLMISDLIFRFVIRQLKKPKLNKLFLWQLLIHPNQRKAVQALANGAAGSMPNISKSNLMAFSIPVPPIELQEQFANIVEKVESIKARYTQSLQGLETLYAALSQKAFKGELDLANMPLLLSSLPQEPSAIKRKVPPPKHDHPAMPTKNNYVGSAGLDARIGEMATLFGFPPLIVGACVATACIGAIQSYVLPQNEAPVQQRIEEIAPAEVTPVAPSVFWNLPDLPLAQNDEEEDVLPLPKVNTKKLKKFFSEATNDLSFQTIVRSLSEQYVITQEVVEKDLIKSLHELLEANFIEQVFDSKQPNQHLTFRKVRT